MKTSLFLGTAISALLVTGLAAADDTIKNFSVDATGENEVPQVNTAVTATGELTLDTTANTLCGTITVTPSNTPITMMHIHTGDETTASGPVLVTLQDTPNASGQINVYIKNLTATDVSTISDQATYLNIHNSDHPDGVVRGQLTADDSNTEAQPCTGTPIDLAATSTADAGTDSGATTTTTTEPDSGTATTTASSSSSSSSGSTTDDSSGCNASGSSSSLGTVGFLAGLGLVVGAIARKRKKA